jgi:tetratricopeptide (TPR) repeat protein
LLLKKDFGQCEVVLKKILNHEQDHLEANLNLGRVYSNLSKFDAAIDQYNIVLKFDKSYFVLFELAVIYYNIGDIQKSSITFNELLKLKTDIPNKGESTT